MAGDLRNLLEHRPVSARVYGPWETLRRATAAHRAALIGGVAAVTLALLGIAVAAASLHGTAKGALFEGMRRQVMDLASMAVVALDPDEVRAATATDDPAAPAVAALERSLAELGGRVPDLRFVWIMRRSPVGGTTLEFVADGIPAGTAETEAPPRIEVPARLGERFDASPYPDLMLGFEGPAADRDYSVTDQWGVALSGYAPIRDAQGDAIAVLGVDMSETDVADRFEEVDRALLITVLLAGTLWLIALATIAVGVSLLWRRQRIEDQG
jgi:hypothetical protein